jgi:RimJ/RimL family protein N-acetyltransferase
VFIKLIGANMTDGPIIGNETFRLRRVLPSDAESIFEAVSESVAEVSLWMPWCNADYSLEESKSWCESRDDAWKKGEEYDFVIIDKTNNHLLGVCGLNHINAEERFANLGYWVRTCRTRKGIASAAVPMIAKFGFDSLNLHRIEIVVAVGNLPSQRVAEKSGAFREGFLRQRLFVHGQIFDAFMFSIVPADFT